MSSAFNTATPADPFDTEIRPGFRIRDLKSVDECTTAIFQVDMDRERIIAQIAKVEAGVLEKTPDWRTKAQSALRWKKRVRLAILNHSATFKATQSDNEARLRALLDGIRTEVGHAEFERLMEIARAHADSRAEGAS